MEVSKSIESQARRVVEYHQAHISDHLLRSCAGAGSEKPFRHTLSTGLDRPRRSRAGSERPGGAHRDYLLGDGRGESGPLDLRGRPVPPPVRLRRPLRAPGSGRSCPPPIVGAGGSTPRASPRQLPPLVYEGIDSSLAGKRLPPTWFADPWTLQAEEPDRQRPTEADTGDKEAGPNEDEAFREDASEAQQKSEASQSRAQAAALGLGDVEVFDPPLRARGLYVLAGAERTEWRPCEVLAFSRSEQQFLIQWFCSGLQKRVNTLQLRFDGESEATAARRRAEAESRRDTVEAMMLEQVVVEELSRWEQEADQATATSARGNSAKRILDLAQLSRYEASEEVVQALVREAAESYSRSQAKWLLLWRRPDLQEYLGIKPVPLPEKSPWCSLLNGPSGGDLSTPSELSLADIPPADEAVPSRPSRPPRPPREKREAETRTRAAERGTLGISKGPGGIRGNLSPNRKFRNLPSPVVVQKSQELAAVSLIGESDPQSRLLQVFDVVGKLYTDDCTPLYCPARKREPYSLQSFSRSLADGFSRSASFYRISWPESITLFYMSETGVVSPCWTQRTSGLVARLMEAGLHNLCLQNLRSLLALMEGYAKVSKARRDGELELTYLPPLVYQRMALVSYEQHPLFRIQVIVERNEKPFVPSLELAVEAFFASADTKSLEPLLHRRHFQSTVQSVTQKHFTEIAKVDMQPDGGAFGGAPSANQMAIQKNTVHWVAQLAAGAQQAIEEAGEESEEEPMASARPGLLKRAVTKHLMDDRVLFEDVEGDLVVKLTAHPKEFREILGEHFRKIVDLTERFTRIDGSLQQDGEVKQQFIASLSGVKPGLVEELQEKFDESLQGCFFDPEAVVHEVGKYSALLRRFSRQALQLERLLREPQRKRKSDAEESASGTPSEHSFLAPAEDREGSRSNSEAEASSLHSEPTDEEDRFAAGLLQSVEEVRENLDCLDAWAQEINESEELNERHMGLFVVDVTPLRKALLAMCACCRLRLLGVVQRWLEDACARLKLSLQAKSTEIIMAPKQPDELHSTIEAVKSLGPFLAEMEPVLGSIRQMFDVLESRCHQVPRPLIKRWYECIHAVPDLRDRADRWQNVFRKDLRGKFNMKIAEKAKFLAAQVEECRLVLEEYACKVSLNKAEFYYTKMKKLQERVCKLQEQVKKQHVHEEMMEMPLSEFPGLAATAEQLAPLLELWYLAHEWTHWKEGILFDDFVKIDPSAVKHKLQTCTETMRFLEEVFATQPRPRQVLHSLSLDLAELRVLLPVIVSLRNPGLRDRHWQRIGEAMNQTIQASQMKEISLSTMNERYPFVAHLSKIQAISETASKEMVIEDELKRMQDQWVKLKFQIKPVSRTGDDGEPIEDEAPTVMAEFYHEQVWELIAEQAAKVRSLGHRPNAAVHAQDLVAHDAKLKAIGELVDLLEESQFGYLCAREHMMNEGLVKDLMQRDTERNKEWKRFFDVEKQWQGILNHLRSAHSYLELLDQKITSNCREAAVAMERIQRSIHDVLDLRRAKVPNLYRLSDAALMKVLRFGHNPAEPAIRDCLPGVLTLDVSASTFSDGKSVRGIVGDSGEYLSLPEELAVQEGSQIEDWLPKLLEMMSKLLRWSLSGLMLSNFHPSDTRLLDEKYALQIRSAALDLAYTSEIESCLVEGAGSATLLQQKRLSICQLIDQLQEKRLQAREAEAKGTDFEGFVEGSSSEEEEEEEPDDLNSISDSDLEDEDDVEEGDEEEELSEDESVSAEEAAAENMVERTMTARKAVRLEPPLMSPSHRASTLVTDGKAGDRGATKPKSRRYNAAARQLPETVLAKMPWRLFQQSLAVAVLQMLRWREVVEQLELEREGGTPGRNPLSSYRWLTTLRHYLRTKSAPATPATGAESYLDRGHYALGLAGLDLDYAWQYLGAFGPSGRTYWDPQTDRGQLVMANAFATARGVLSTNPNIESRSEAAATIARSLGVVQEKIVVNWQSSVVSIWRHLEGALLAGLCLSVTIDASAHVQVVAVLAQELNSHFNSVRTNMSQGGASPRSGWVHLDCHEECLNGPQRLPLLLLRTFRPTSMPTPSLDALCELWLLSSGIRPTIAKSTARTAAFAWRFLESAGAETKAGQFRCLPLWQLRILCEVTAKVMQQVRMARRGVKGRASSIFGSDTRRNSRSGSTSMGIESQGMGFAPGVESNSPDKMRRVSGAGMVLQETAAPTWARASLVQAFKVCFFGDQSSWAPELNKLLNVSKEDEEKLETGALQAELAAAAKTVLEEMGLVGHPEHVQAVHRLNLWINLCHSETDLVVGAPSTRAVLVLGGTAVGKSTCVDALAKLSAKDSEQPWELRRVNAASLALDASDSLLRPVAGTSRLQPPSSSSGVLQQIEGKKTPTKSRKVLVHVDGELAPSLHGAFVASLSGVSPPGCIMRQGLHLSAQSWIHLRAPSSLSRLAVAFEMGEEGSRTLSPDLVARCGVVHLPTEEDFRKEIEQLVSGWVAEAERQYDNAKVSSTVTRLCEWVVIPLLIFLFRDEETTMDGDEEAYPSFNAAMRHVKEVLAPPSNEKAAATTSRKSAGNKKKLAWHLKSLENAWMLDVIPRRVLFCRIRDAFFAVYNHSSRVQREARQQQLELEAQAEADRLAARSRLGTELESLSRSRFASENGESMGLASVAMLLPATPRSGSRRPSRVPSRQASPEASPTESGTIRRRSSNMAKKAAVALLAPGVETKEEEVVMLDVEAAVALVFATMSTLSAVARDSAVGVLEDALHRLVELLGAPAANLRLPVEFSILDAVPDEHLKGFYHLDSFLKEPDTADMDAYVFVPTAKSKRFVSLATVLGRSQTHLALLGPPGSGKTSLLSQTIAQLPLRETPTVLPAAYSSHCSKVSPTPGTGTRVELLYMCATHWLPSGKWERILQQNLVRTSQHGLSPRLYSWCLFVIDDCHCAPPTLREAWRFAVERGLVHSAGARGPTPARKPAQEGPGKRPAERAEREAAAPSIRRMEGVMMLLAARSASALAQRHNFMRHVWAFTLEPLQEADLLKIVGDNMSHFIFVKDITTRVVANKMHHVRLLHALQVKLQETQSTTRLITPHVMFRFFKGLLSQPTECLCDLQPQEFHRFFLHELLRETADRLPLHRQKSVIQELARLQLSMFGGLDSDGECCAAPETVSGGGAMDDNRLEACEEGGELQAICEKLESMYFTSLASVAAEATKVNPHRVERAANYADASGQLAELRGAIRADLQRGWSRAQVMSNQVSSLLASLYYWGGPDSQFTSSSDAKPENPLRGCAGLEPRHLLLSDEYVASMLRVGRLMDLVSSPSRYKVWDRSGGKTLLFASSVPVAISLLRGLCFFHGLSFDTPFGKPGSEGADTGGTGSLPGFHASAASAMLGSSHETLRDASTAQPPTADAEAFRSWLKEKMLGAVQEGSRWLLCIPPALLNQTEVLAVLHEAFSQEGPPSGWFSEREVRDCEAAVAALDPEKRWVAHLVLQEDEGDAPPGFDVFWAEALGRIHFVLLASTFVPEDRLSSFQLTPALLDAYCPTLLQQLAVVQLPPPSAEAYISAAQVQLESPILDFDTWQPESPHKADLRTSQIAEAAAALARAAHAIAARQPAGMSPRLLRASQDLGDAGPATGPAQAPRLPAANTTWYGEAVDSGIVLPPPGGLGDVSDLLTLAQGLSRLKGAELHRRHSLIKDSQSLLQQLHEAVALSVGSEMQVKLIRAQSSHREAQTASDEKSAEHKVLHDQLTRLLNEVVNNCIQKSNDVEAMEASFEQVSRDLEAHRFQLINFSKQDYAELKKALNQNCPAGEEKERTPIVALFEMCCLLLRTSSAPTRDDVRSTIGEPLFATKLAAVDAESFPADLLPTLAEAAAVADTRDYMDVKAVAAVSNVVFPAYQLISHSVKLPALKAELAQLQKIREERMPEVEALQQRTHAVASEAKEREAEAQKLQQEMETCEGLASNAVEQKTRMGLMSQGLRHDRIRWGWKLQELSNQLLALPGDALLSAAATLFAGPLGPAHREELMAHWKAVLDNLSIPHSKELDLPKYWIPATARCRWHAELELPKDSHLEESIVLACLQTTSWPIFYDPDGLAVPFLTKFFPGSHQLTMGSTDFQKDMLTALQRASGGGGDAADDAAAHVLIIENTYLPALREMELLTELLSRRQLRAAGLMSKGASIALTQTGVEDAAVSVDPKTVIIFVTQMAEPLARDLLSTDFAIYDFRLSREPQCQGPLLDMLSCAVCEKALPGVHQELKQLRSEFAPLVDEWQRLDDDLAGRLSAHYKADVMAEGQYPSEEQVREVMNTKMAMDSLGRRLLKQRDSEAKLLQHLSANDHLVASLSSLVTAAEELFSLCPSSNLSLAGAAKLAASLLPELPSEGAKKPKGRSADTDYAAAARRAILAGIWEHVAPGLPQQLILPAALRLATASAVPQLGLQQVLGKLLLQNPSAEPALLRLDLNGALCSAIQAVLKGKPLSEALQSLRQTAPSAQETPRSSPAPRSSFSVLYSLPNSRASSKRSLKNSESGRAPSKTLASVARGVVTMGAFARALNEEAEDDEQPVSAASSARRSSTAQEAEALRAAGAAKNLSNDLLQQLFSCKGHWEKCSAKTTFLARFCYFQEAFRSLLEQVIEEQGSAHGPEVEGAESQSKDANAFALADLFRISRFELFGVDEKYLENLLNDSSHERKQTKGDSRILVQRVSTRTLAGEAGSAAAEEGATEGSADTPAVLAILFQCMAMGGPAPSALAVSVDGPSLGFLVDRFEDSVAGDAAAWARWADAVASGALRGDGGGRRGGALNSGHTLMEHLPLLASLPHELISSLLPQGFGLGPGGVTLRATSSGAVLQTMLFAVLASHSLTAVMAGAEAFVAGLTGLSTPCRRPRFPALVEAAAATQPVVCLCETEASPVLDELQDMARRGQRKMVQVALGLTASPTADSAKAGVLAGEQPNKWGPSGPVATSAFSSTSVLELVDECKDVGYWLLLHIVPHGMPRLSSAESTGIAVDAWGGWQLLEWIWFNMSTPSFRAAVDENFRLFVVMDARLPELLPDWIFRSSCNAICLFDSQTGLSLRPWLELSLNSLRRKSPLMPEISSQVATPTSSKGKYDLLGGFKSLQDAAMNSRLSAQGRMARITSSTVLFSRLTQPSFVLKLGLSALRLSLQLVLAAVAACERATCLPSAWLMRARPLGGLDADLADEALHRVIQLQNFEASVTLRSVDVLEIVATLIVHQAEEVGPLWVDVGGNAGPGASPILYNLLRFFRQSHLSRHRQDMTGPPPSADSTKMSQLSEMTKRASAQRNSSLNVSSLNMLSVGGGRKSRKPMEVETAVDEALWFHDENYEPTEGSLWTIFGQVADLVDDLLSKGEPGQPLLKDEDDATAMTEILKLLPLVDHNSTVRLAGASPQIFALALPFARARPGKLWLSPLPSLSLKEHSDASSSASLPMMEDESEASVEVEVDEVQAGDPVGHEKRKVSGVQTLQFQIPSMGALPSNSSDGSQDDVEGVLEKCLFDLESQTGSKEGLVHLLKATITCITSSHLCEEDPGPIALESSLQAEWRRQRQEIATWANGICREARSLLRGLREGFDTLSLRLILKLRHLLHLAHVRAAQAIPQETAEIRPPAMSLGDCPAEVWHVAKSPLALSTPVPDGWQPPHYLEEASYGAWLSRLAQRLHKVYLPRDVPKRLHVADLAQVAPLLLALRLDFAAQRHCTAEQTCLVFLPVGEDDEPGSPTSDLLKGEKCVVAQDFTTWDELDVERPPCFYPACELPSTLTSALSPLKLRSSDDTVASEVLRPPSPPMTHQKTAPPTLSRIASDEEPSSPSRAGSMLKQSVRKIQILGALGGKTARRQSVAVRKKAKEAKENKIFHKDLALTDVILTGLLADGAVWSSTSGLYIDSNAAGLARLPPLRAVATTFRTAEQFVAQCFPQASGCINLTVYRVTSTPWPMPPQGSLIPAKPREVCAVRLPFVCRSGHKWQPLALLDALPPQPCRGHLRQWESEGSAGNEEVHGTMDDQLQEPLSIPRPFASHPAALPALAGPPHLSARMATKAE